MLPQSSVLLRSNWPFGSGLSIVDVCCSVVLRLCVGGLASDEVNRINGSHLSLRVDIYHFSGVVVLSRRCSWPLHLAHLGALVALRSLPAWQ